MATAPHRALPAAPLPHLHPQPFLSLPSGGPVRPDLGEEEGGLSRTDWPYAIVLPGRDEGDQAGSRITALNPPIGERSRLNSPPWLRATSLAIAKPRPTPLSFWLRDSSSRLNGRNASS